MVLTILAFVLLFVLCGLMGSWTGAGGEKGFRRIGVPVITTILGVIGLWSLWAVLLMARAAVLSIGYGIPDPQSKPEPRDKGSKLGAFWYNIFTHDGQVENASNTMKAGIATRGTIGFLEGISIIAIPLIKGGAGAWSLWLWALVLLCINNILFGEIVKKEGTIHIFGKELLLEEIYVHGIDSVIIGALIFLCR